MAQNCQKITIFFKLPLSEAVLPGCRSSGAIHMDATLVLHGSVPFQLGGTADQLVALGLLGVAPPSSLLSVSEKAKQNKTKKSTKRGRRTSVDGEQAWTEKVYAIQKNG